MCVPAVGRAPPEEAINCHRAATTAAEEQRSELAEIECRIGLAADSSPTERRLEGDRPPSLARACLRLFVFVSVSLGALREDHAGWLTQESGADQ